MRFVRAAVPLVVAGTSLLLGTVGSPASAATVVADWQLDEPAGATVMVDGTSNHLDGTVGAHVRTGVVVGSSHGYRFPAGVTSVDPAHLVTVPDSALLDPGSQDLAITLRLQTTGQNANVLQKGQAGQVGGFYKVEVVNGKASCTFKGASGIGVAASLASIADGVPHVVTCARTSTGVQVTVDGATRTAPKPTGAIDNTAPVSIGGKVSCNTSTNPCQYFGGFVDSVTVARS